MGGIAGVNDCPGGVCEGKNNEFDQDCHCICVDAASGVPSPAGSASCRLGVTFRLEADALCDNNQVLIREAPGCVPLTSTAVSARILNNGETGTTLGPYTDAGTPLSCAAFDTSTTAGLTLVGDLALFDTSYGDWLTRWRFHCL